MSRTIEIRGLTDAQCDALKAEAEAAGLKFFDLCRVKLLEGLAEAPRFVHYEGGKPMTTPKAPVRPPAAAPSEPDRIGRLEEMMGQMAETLQMLASNPAQLVQAELVAEDAEIDLDDVVGQSLDLAEQQGLTAVEREQPAQNGGVRHIGQRRPAPFSVSTVPSHLRNL